MKLSPLTTKLLSRFEILITEGEAILGSKVEVGARYKTTRLGQSFMAQPGYTTVNFDAVIEWRTKCTNMLGQILPEEHPLHAYVEDMRTLRQDVDRVRWGVAVLKGLKKELEDGFLDSLISRIEAEIVADYMSQAEQLLAEGQTGRYDHVPAAVLSGAVLEKGLRTLCLRQMPPVHVDNPKGEPKTLNPLIDDLKKANVFNELKAKQLRAWADIRNKAAHGEFDQFKRSDVEHMIQGINTFLADYL